MNYIEDHDLEFLCFCSNERLKVLVDFLMFVKEDLGIESPSLEPRIINCNGDYQQVWYLIAGELQNLDDTSGSSGHGLLFRELLSNVCSSFNVSFDRESPIYSIEYNLLLKMAEQAIEVMGDNNRWHFVRAVGLDMLQLEGTTKADIMVVLERAIGASGFTTYTLATIIAHYALMNMVHIDLADARRIMAIDYVDEIRWVISSKGFSRRQLTRLTAVLLVAYLRQTKYNWLFIEK